jgi:hypothetical protein
MCKIVAELTGGSYENCRQFAICERWEGRDVLPN